MSNSPIRKKEWLKQKYNEEPVHYCTDCLSLAVMRVAGLATACYCKECGCTDIATAQIEDWEELYKKRHGFTFLNSNY